MKNCPQTETQSVYDHGVSVWEHTKKLIAGNFEGFKLPLWFVEGHREIVNNLHPTDVIKNYNIFHDCGKPYCIEFDDEGNKHFPHHENVSKETWLKYSDDEVVAELIGYDMALHRDTADLINSYGWSKQTAFTLLLTAFAEIHSNAKMFGGVDSTSFKIKWKKLDKRGCMIMKSFKEDEDHPYSYVIVRKDIKFSHQAVQGTHAAIEYFKGHFHNLHPSIIYVVVKDEKKLKQVAETLLDQEITFSIFRETMEPYNGDMTAICTEPLSGDKRNYLKKFMLM